MSSVTGFFTKRLTLGRRTEFMAQSPLFKPLPQIQIIWIPVLCWPHLKTVSLIILVFFPLMPKHQGTNKHGHSLALSLFTLRFWNTLLALPRWTGFHLGMKGFLGSTRLLPRKKNGLCERKVLLKDDYPWFTAVSAVAHVAPTTY